MSGRPPYEIVFFEDDAREKPCLKWIKEDLTPSKRRALGAAMLEVLQEQGTNVVSAKSWGRQLGDGMVEFRLDRTVEGEAMTLRVFFHGYGDKKLLLLHGYDKGDDPSSRRQQREIAVGKRRLREWREAEKKKRAAQRKRKTGGTDSKKSRSRAARSRGRPK